MADVGSERNRPLAGMRILDQGRHPAYECRVNNSPRLSSLISRGRQSSREVGQSLEIGIRIGPEDIIVAGTGHHL